MTAADLRRIAYAMSETELQENIRDLCKVLRLPVQHIHDSRRCWLPGWPDVVVFGSRIIYRELKSETGSLSPEQRSVGSRIAKAGGDWSLWRPRDWTSGVIRRELEEITEQED